MTSRTNPSKTMVLLLGAALAALGCERAQASAEPAAEAVAPMSSAASAGAAVQASARVTRVVFVGKEHACDCTRKTVDAGWAALQQALGTPARVPVERLQVDTQPDKVAPYRDQKPMVAMPALYFVDAKNGVVELLQGEVTAAQITAALAK